MSSKKEKPGKEKKTSRSAATESKELQQKVKETAGSSNAVAAKAVNAKPANKTADEQPAAARKASKKRKAKKKKPSVLKKAFNFVIVICCMFIIWCGYLVWLMNDHPADRQIEHADAGIILGAALWRDQPSPALRERLIKAVELYEAGKVDYLVLSGGTGGLLSTISEAEGMRNFLVEKGVPEDKLLLESESVNTFQNIRFSQNVMQEHNINSSIIITHDYHLPRAIEMASYLKLESVQGAAVHSKVLNPVYNQAREILSLSKWKLEWLLLKIGILSPDSIK